MLDSLHHCRFIIFEKKCQAWYNSKAVRACLSIFDFLPMKVGISTFSLECLHDLQGLLYHSLLMAMNRLAVFSVPSMRSIFDKQVNLSEIANYIFSRESIGWMIVGCWSLIISFSTLSALVRPTQRFNQDSLRFERSGEIIMDIPVIKLVRTTVKLREKTFLRQLRFSTMLFRYLSSLYTL